MDGKKYVFDIKKKFESIFRFKKLRDPSKIDIETIKDIFNEILTPKKPKIAKAPLPAPTSNIGSTIKKLVFMALGTIAIFFIIFGLVIYSALNVQPAQPPPPTQFEMFLPRYTQLYSGVLSYGNEEEYISYITFRLAGQYLNKVNVSARFFNESVPYQILLLKSYSIEADSYPKFKASLDKQLESYGLPLSYEVPLSRVQNLPEGSKAIIIVPTGYIPASFLGLENGFNFMQLINNDSVIIYLGKDFTKAVRVDGTIIPVEESIIEKFNIKFTTRPSMPTSGGFHLENSLYSVSVPKGSVSVLHNTMFSANWGTPGYFVFLPQTLDGGWKKNGSAAGYDVARLINEIAWLSPYTKGEVIVKGEGANGTIDSVATLYTTFFPHTKTGGFVRVNIEAIYVNGSVLRRNLPMFQVYPTVNGTLQHDNKVSNGTQLLLKPKFIENFSAPKKTQFHLIIFENEERVSSELFTDRKISMQFIYDLPTDYVVNLPEGEYILRVLDDDGYTYAQSYLKVTGIKVVQASPVSYYPIVFEFTSEGEPFKDREVGVQVDGVNRGIVKTDENGYLMYPFAGLPPLSEGVHEFVFTTAGKIIPLTAEYRPEKQWYQIWYNQVIMVLTLIVLGIGYFLQRTPPVIYGLDVPDFLPTRKEVTPVPKTSVIGLFDNINRDYKWNFMPLTLKEIKDGFRRRLMFKGKPILISDINLKKLLSQLIEEKLVFKSLNLYGLEKWVDESKKSPKYLAVFRHLRTIFINNIVFFTELGKRDDCDTLITMGNKNIYIHIYEKDTEIKRVLGTLGKGTNILVFQSNEVLEEFLKGITNSAGKTATILKAHIDSNRLFLTSVSDFEKLLKKTYGMKR